jgi:hypothetical protein
MLTTFLMGFAADSSAHAGDANKAVSTSAAFIVLQQHSCVCGIMDLGGPLLR